MGTFIVSLYFIPVMSGMGLWAELSLFSSKKCIDMLAGSADDWDGFETFHPETEVCAARVSKIKMEEMQVRRARGNED